MLDEEDPVILDVVLKWLYTNTYMSPSIGNNIELGRALDHQQHRDYQQDLKMDHLQTLVMVYCCADRFLLDDLKHVCVSETARTLVPMLANGGRVPAVLQQIFENTTSADPLRAMVLEHCVRLHTQLQHDTLTVAVLKHFEPLCWDIGTRLAQKNNEVTRQNNSNLSEVTRLTRANEASTKTHAILTHKVSEAEQKCYTTMWRLRNFLRDEIVCAKCGSDVTKSRMLIRLLHNQYAIDCQKCRHRVWWTSR